MFLILFLKNLIYKEILSKELKDALDKVIKNGVDVNTAFREAEELATKEIASSPR